MDKKPLESKKWTMGAVGVVAIECALIITAIVPDIATAAAAAMIAIGGVVSAVCVGQAAVDYKQKA